MRILVTGATGFVGRWLMEELASAGHEAIGTPASADLDVSDARAVLAFVQTIEPDAVAHLAGVAYAPDASRDPRRARAVNVGGTRAVLEAVIARGRPIPVLVAGSSDVYGRPAPSDLPLREGAPLRADQPYGRSKLAQERAALEIGNSHEMMVVVTRSFNHTGPGQRPHFVAPALAHRVLEARESGSREIAVGNLDVRRDIGDVRDVVRAYRLLIEAAAADRIRAGTVLNVATGRAVAIRQLLAMISEAVGISVNPRMDESLVREDDPPEIIGDPTALRRLTGWAPLIPLRQTIGDLVTWIARRET